MSNREKYLQRRFGISEKDYERMFTAQSKGCAICGRPPKKNHLAVDHDHKTGRVRGLLCYNCNRRLIGRFRNPETFEKAARYLRRKKALGL